MIQSTLFFILGFLCAAFLAACGGARVLASRGQVDPQADRSVDAADLNEIQAEADSVRAEAAMTIRRLEINVKTLKEKIAEQLVEINRGREELRRLADENVERWRAISSLL